VSETPPTSEARETARIRFLQIAHELKPELVRSLYEDVLPEYPNHLEALRAWLKESNLFEEWQLKHTTHSIWMWNSEGLDYDPDAGWPHLSASYSPALQDLKLNSDVDVAWDRVTPVDEAEEEALAKWEKHCSEERKRIKVHYKALRGSQKKSGNDPDRHIRWLVRRQILGATFKEIERSERANVDLETIRKGVMSATEKTGSFNSEQPELEVWDNDTTDVHYIVD
jgi:hypothetical protein